MYLISSRRKFWDNNAISKKPYRIGEVNLSRPTYRMKPKKVSDYKSLIRDKKILLLCHGYANEPYDVMRAYRTIEINQSSYIGYFDVVVGYTWPGGDDWSDYRAAKNRASAVASRFTSLLQTTMSECSELGVMSHSMGCRISLLAHNELSRRSASRRCNGLWQYLIAAAVDNESVELILGNVKNALRAPTMRCVPSMPSAIWPSTDATFRLFYIVIAPTYFTPRKTQSYRTDIDLPNGIEH